MAESVGEHARSTTQRVASILGLVTLAALVLLTILVLWSNVLALLLGLAGALLVFTGGAWTLTHAMPRKLLGIGVLLLGLVVQILGLTRLDGTFATVVLRLCVLLGLTALLLWLAHAALDGDQEPHEPDHRARRTPHLKHPVLIYNERSGDGKVIEFDIVRRAQAIGVRTIAFDEGDDLIELGRAAVSDGADCLGMAGGDGSQALVASVAVEAGLPFVCIPAGTRNHFARDLGLECSDPASVLEAFVNGRRRRVDYGTVGDRLFVNNVSLGAYATITQSPDYRESKLVTAMSLLPEIIGPDATPADLDFVTPDGEAVEGATVVLVSNNAYTLGLSVDAASRASITDGRLGVLAVRVESGSEAIAAVAQASIGLPTRNGSLLAFDVARFEVRSGMSEVEAAIDGEATSLPTPLEFAIHPRGLSLLLPRSARHRRRRVSLRRLIVVAIEDLRGR